MYEEVIIIILLIIIIVNVTVYIVHLVGGLLLLCELTHGHGVYYNRRGSIALAFALMISSNVFHIQSSFFTETYSTILSVADNNGMLR
jgi:uncharacterized membrane protein YecN with MAPEG domain